MGQVSEIVNDEAQRNLQTWEPNIVYLLNMVLCAYDLGYCNYIHLNTTIKLS